MVPHLLDVVAQVLAYDSYHDKPPVLASQHDPRTRRSHIVAEIVAQSSFKEGVDAGSPLESLHASQDRLLTRTHALQGLAYYTPGIFLAPVLELWPNRAASMSNSGLLHRHVSCPDFQIATPDLLLVVGALPLSHPLSLCPSQPRAGGPYDRWPWRTDITRMIRRESFRHDRETGVWAN
ncbi:hypothetical protein GALMADRAFT_161135 [Galerina marginata CBS 339.88]|uniref:Uncharacterized protein n=1 Tax=Galerina marginata (strain CBS 339.88) TaxID=685588 RepID=A0A067SKH8_GALM3|nr:hypothetical protein GALMADRAFT_161135 [Galerina marginata CBS 339.88]